MSSPRSSGSFSGLTRLSCPPMQWSLTATTRCSRARSSRSAIAVVAAIALLTIPAAAGRCPAAAVAAATPVTVVIDPGHDRYANTGLEPIGPGSRTLKIKDGGGTHGVITGQSEASVNLRIALRLRALLQTAG